MVYLLYNMRKSNPNYNEIRPHSHIIIGKILIHQSKTFVVTQV